MTRRRTGRWVGRMLWYLLDRDGYRCARCGRITLPGSVLSPERRPSVGHVVPLSAGGSNDPGNLRVECVGCNVAARDDDDPPAILAVS